MKSYHLSSYHSEMRLGGEKFNFCLFWTVFLSPLFARALSAQNSLLTVFFFDHLDCAWAVFFQAMCPRVGLFPLMLLWSLWVQSCYLHACFWGQRRYKGSPCFLTSFPHYCSISRDQACDIIICTWCRSCSPWLPSHCLALRCSWKGSTDVWYKIIVSAPNISFNGGCKWPYMSSWSSFLTSSHRLTISLKNKTVIYTPNFVERNNCELSQKYYLQKSLP